MAEMDFDEIMDTILESKHILLIQLCFYCFRSFIEEQILSNKIELDWSNLQELCEKYCDEEWKPYIMDFFNPDVEEYEDEELLETFFRNFAESFNELIQTDDIVMQDKFTDFLDVKLFEVFKDSIFPTNCEDTLNLEKYLELKMLKLEKEEEQEQSKKTFILKRKHFGRLNGTPIKNKIIFSKTRKNKNVPV